MPHSAINYGRAATAAAAVATSSLKSCRLDVPPPPLGPQGIPARRRRLGQRDPFQPTRAAVPANLNSGITVRYLKCYGGDSVSG